MMQRFPILLLSYALILAACSLPEPEFPSGEFIDLTYAFDENTVFWPTAEEFELEVVSAGVTEAGFYYASNNFCTSEHGGTHIDAPIHFYEGRQTVDEIPLGRLIGKAVLIDVSDKCAADRDYRVQVEDLTMWEQEHAMQLSDVIVLIRTGFGQYWPDRVRYMGTDERGPQALAKLHFPGLHPDAAEWLTENRSIKAIGMDTPSIDYGQSELFESHVSLFEHNVPVIENLANLDKLPETDFQVIALPMKIKGGSGGPARIIALVPN